MPNKWLTRKSALIPLALAPLAISNAQAQDADASAEEESTETVIVTGTRASGVDAFSSSSPIQVLSAESIESAGRPDLMNALANIVPSFTAQAFGGDMAFADAGAGDDPLVAGVDQLGHVLVGQHPFRQVAAGAGDAGVDATFGLTHARTPGRPFTITRLGRDMLELEGGDRDVRINPGCRNADGRTSWRGRASSCDYDLAAAGHSSSTTLVFGAMTCLPR